MYGNVLRQARESRGLTQQQLAAIAGIAQSNISAYENNRREPAASTLHHLLIACGYELVARAGDQLVRFPFPENYPDVEPIETHPAPTPRNDVERNEMMMAALQASEALLAMTDRD